MPADGLLGGRFRLEERITADAVADVHRATDLRLNRPVAVKMFRPGAGPDAGRRFRDEAWTLANLSHPGLVAVHDFAVEGHRAYLVMELIEGPTLDEVLTRERLSPDEITRIGADVADVLAYVHEQGVVHRDVQPSNLQPDREGRVRLANFGIAQDGAALTAAYLAPEQVRGALAGPPADVYALGLVLLEAATGRREARAESWGGDGQDAAAARPASPPSVPRTVPEPLRGAIAAMTGNDPARRPTARQVNGMLAGGLAEQEPPEPTQEPEPERRGRFGMWALALVALLAVLVAIVVATSGTEELPPVPPPVPGTAENGSGDNGSSGDSDEGGGGFELPPAPEFDIPDIPDLPDVPDLSDLPDLPDVPEVPDSVAEDAQGLWEQFTDWFARQF